MKIGIDFGTTFSLPATLINGTATTLLPGGAYAIPSAFYYDEKTEILIGTPAVNRGNIKVNNIVRNIKMEISNTSKKSFKVGGREFGKKEIVGNIFKEIVRIAKDEIERKQLSSQNIDGAVISVPAAFELREVNFIKQVAEDYAGLKVLGFIKEPVAAAISYFNAPSAEDKKTILVYDCGGGTCDVAIIRSDANAKDWYTVLASDMRRIGGRDWDKVLAEMIKRQCRSEDEDIEFTKRDESNILQEAIHCKHTLSDLEKFVGEVEVGESVFDIEITRKDFERKTFELLKETMDMVDCLINQFGSKIDYIVCVGGSSNMPQVKAAFRKNYPDIELKLFEPEKAIAFGAAIYAEHLTEGNYLRDICKFSYGARYIEDYDRYHDYNRLRIYNIIYKNENLPASGNSTSWKIEDGQDSIYIAIYESECMDEKYLPEKGTYIGDIRISGLKNSQKGDETLLTMTIDKSGLMQLKAVDKRTGKNVQAEIQLEDY